MARTDTTPESELGALRQVPYMGVIFVVAEAMKLGFTNGDPDWCNLGQGQPEVGDMAGAPPRVSSVEIRPEDHAYGPLEGTVEMREAVAAHYNRLYRRGRGSQYGAANVCVAQGGRLALSRAMVALAGGKVGYQVPDYTAYEDMFNAATSTRIEPIVRAHAREADGFALTTRRLREGLVGRPTTCAPSCSRNPCNPTGVVIAGDELAASVIGHRASVTSCLPDPGRVLQPLHLHARGAAGPSGAVSGAELTSRTPNTRPDPARSTA